MRPDLHTIATNTHNTELQMSDEKNYTKTLNETIAEVMREVLPAAIGAATMASQPRGKALPSSEKCGECGQYVRACKGEHVQMVVWCRDLEADKWFLGVKLNGVTYISPAPGVPITVPKENDIASILSGYEQGEKEMMRGKKVEHNSGSVNSFRPAQGFR